MSQYPRFSPQKQPISGHATAAGNAPAGVPPRAAVGCAAVARGWRNPGNPRDSDSFSNGPPRSRAISEPPLPRLLGGRSARASLLDRGDLIPHQVHQKVNMEARARQSLPKSSQRWGASSLRRSCLGRTRCWFASRVGVRIIPVRTNWRGAVKRRRKRRCDVNGSAARWRVERSVVS
jgi:hypothetical protein